MEKIVKVMLLSLMFFTTFAGAEVKNFYINGVGNTRRDAERTNDKIEEVTGLKMQKPLYNSTEGVFFDFLEATGQFLRIDKIHQFFSDRSNEFKEILDKLDEEIQKENNETKRKILIKVVNVSASVDNFIDLKNFFENPKEFQVELMKLHFSLGEIAVPKVIKNLI